VDRVFGWLAEYSYACVLIAAAIDAMALPFPGRLVLLSAGILAAAGRVDLLGTIAAGLGGAVVGDHLWYFGGRLARGRLHALHRWLARRRVRLATDPVAYLRRHGGLVILIGRFIATVRVLVWPIASAHGIGYGRFLAWDLGAAALWVGVFVLGGYVFGGPALTMMKGLGGPAFIAAGVGVSVVGGGMLMWRRRRRRRPRQNRLTSTHRRRRSS
jgi:membrane protein DedA with SNARE-associated domain